MIISPDYIYSTAGAADYLGKSQRHVQRILKSGELVGVRHNGRWHIPAISLWQYHGIEEKMTGIWLQFCLAKHAESERQENSLITIAYKPWWKVVAAHPG